MTTRVALSARSACGTSPTSTIADSGLVPIRLETWLGFVFICFDQNAPALATYLGDLHRYVHSYGLESMVTVKRESFDLRTNWKFYIENSMENFHLPTVHQKTIGNVQAEWVEVIGENYFSSCTRRPTARAPPCRATPVLTGFPRLMVRPRKGPNTSSSTRPR